MMRYAEDEEPIIAKKQLPMPANFVAPLAKRAPATIDAPAWMVQQQPLDIARGWQTLEGAQEHTSAMDRAKALRVRLVPFLWGWLGLSAVVGAAVLYVAENVPVAGLLTLLLFSALTAFTYIRLNGQDYAHSREGTERHKVDVAADLARMQMQHEQELRRMAMGFYVKQLEGRERD
jgi:hypothetical protein